MNLSIGIQMFVSDPPYDKTLQQLQGFLSRLVAEEKLEFREGIYRRRQMWFVLSLVVYGRTPLSFAKLAFLVTETQLVPLSVLEGHTHFRTPLSSLRNSRRFCMGNLENWQKESRVNLNPLQWFWAIYNSIFQKLWYCRNVYKSSYSIVNTV